jgi:hypothetical protein
MTERSRAGCAARLLYRDRHLCTGAWWTVISPTGETYELCSGACLVSFAVLGALPGDLEACDSVQPSDSEVAA